MVGTLPTQSQTGYRIRIRIPESGSESLGLLPRQPHRSKLLCHCANEHDEACVHRHSDVVVLGVIHPHKESIVLIALVVLFVVIPLLTAACIHRGGR